MNTDQIKRRQLIFRSRKGLLELDLMLTQYCQNGLVSLQSKELEAFEYLLDLPDQDFLIILLSTDASNIQTLLSSDPLLAQAQELAQKCETVVWKIQDCYKKSR